MTWRAISGRPYYEGEAEAGKEGGGKAAPWEQGTVAPSPTFEQMETAAAAGPHPHPPPCCGSVT
jgi:hypothetical protein